MAAAGVIALVGFMVLTALVSFLATRLGNFPLCCVIIGAVYFVMGAAMAVVLTKKLTGQPLPKTRIELEKDKEWVKQHQYLEFRQELQNVMAETVGEIRPELAEEFEWKTYVQRHPGTCLLWGTRFDPWQKLALTVSGCSSTAKKSGSQIFDIPKNAGQGGFLSFGGSPSSTCAKMRRFSKLTNPAQA